MLKLQLKWGCFLIIITILFFWKILLTDQFSLLTESEGVNQGYSWYQFSASSLKNAALPLWDPYVFSGRSFVGEMQTGAYYPLNLLLALAPFDRFGVLAPQVYNWFFALAHFLAACVMFALVREFGLGPFPAMVGAVCFAFGGYVGGVPWPHYLWSSIWLPLIFLFVMRAIKTAPSRWALFHAVAAGAALGMSILAGGMHLAIMQTIVIATALVVAAWRGQLNCASRWIWVRCAVLVATMGAVAFATGAIQLLPSIEYGRLSVRWVGAHALPATQKIPYAYLQDGLSPQGILLFLLPFAFDYHVGAGEVFIPYLGAFPLLLAAIGAWKARANLWVRYLAGLAVAAYVFSLGSFSLLHGVLYALVPFLWLAREAGRFLYLADFALAILAAFGAEILFSTAVEPRGTWTSVERVLKWVAIACILLLCIPRFSRRSKLVPGTICLSS